MQRSFIEITYLINAYRAIRQTIAEGGNDPSPANQAYHQAMQQDYDIALAGFGYVLHDHHPEIAEQDGFDRLAADFSGVSATPGELTLREAQLQSQRDACQEKDMDPIVQSAVNFTAAIAGVGIYSLFDSRGVLWPVGAALAASTITYLGIEEYLAQRKEKRFTRHHGQSRDTLLQQYTDSCTQCQQERNARQNTEDALIALRDNKPEIFGRNPDAVTMGENILLRVVNVVQAIPSQTP